MSARNQHAPLGAENVWQFARLDEGGYDLGALNDACWERFDRFFRATDDRNIVVQVEVWAAFDYGEPWEETPFNPKNNVTYSVDESGLRERVNASPGETSADVQPFF